MDIVTSPLDDGHRNLTKPIRCMLILLLTTGSDEGRGVSLCGGERPNPDLNPNPKPNPNAKKISNPNRNPELNLKSNPKSAATLTLTPTPSRPCHSPFPNRQFYDLFYVLFSQQRQFT